MNTRRVKNALWRLALRMNPQTATLTSRALATAVGGKDTPTQFNLLRVTYRELTNQELAMAGATLSDVLRVWTIYQVDLDLCSGPTPQLGYQLSFSDGTNWIMRNVKAVAMNQAFECLCSQDRPQ